MKSKIQSKIFRWLPVIVWASIIFIFSSFPKVAVTQFFIWDLIIKKSAHIAEYAILYILLYRANNKKIIISLALTALYATSDELHQSFVPGRNASVFDLGFDLTGVNIASYIIWKLNQFHRIKPKKSQKN